MITTMTIDNWLELELVRGINDQGLQKRILLERNPTLQAMISIATQWQSAETAMAQFIVDNESSETNSESEETNDIHYKRTPNRSKGPVTNNLNYTGDQAEREENTQMNSNKRGKDTSTTCNDGRVRVKNHMSKRSFDGKPKMHNVKITPVTSRY